MFAHCLWWQLCLLTTLDLKINVYNYVTTFHLCKVSCFSTHKFYCVFCRWWPCVRSRAVRIGPARFAGWKLQEAYTKPGCRLLCWLGHFYPFVFCLFTVYVVFFVSLFLVVSTSVIDSLERLVSEMTCYVLSGMLNPTHSVTVLSMLFCWQDHKPDNAAERARIESCGGEVTVKAGVSRVVWKRPCDSLIARRRSLSHTDNIPFLAIARSLGQCHSFVNHNSRVTVTLRCRAVPDFENRPFLRIRF